MVANGALSADQLATIDAAGHELRLDAAVAWVRLRQLVRAAHGWTPVLGTGWTAYRSLEQQVALLRTNYDHTYRAGLTYANGGVRYYAGRTWYRRPGYATAATPGTSNHGLGVAGDVEGLGGFTSTRYLEFGSIAPSCGFTNTEGRSVGEWWHWTYRPELDEHAPAPTAPATQVPAPGPAPTQEDEDIMGATREEVAADLRVIVREELGRLAHPAAAFAMPGTAAAYLDLGTVRRWASGAQLEAYGIGITPAGPRDPFWRLPIVGDPGEVLRKRMPDGAIADGGAVWLVADGGRRWLDAAAHEAAGRPLITDVPSTSDVWALPVIGATPGGAA